MLAQHDERAAAPDCRSPAGRDSPFHTVERRTQSHEPTVIDMNMRPVHYPQRPPPQPARREDDPRALHAPSPLPPARAEPGAEREQRNWRRGYAEFEM